MFTDSHCHLTFPELAADWPAIRAAMAAAQVTRALCISTTMEEAPQVQALAAAHDNLWATVGVHPDSEDVHEPGVDELLAAARQPKVVAIGETGLDYYQMDERKGGRAVADLDWQRQRFRTHIRAARRACLPLVIHTRAASADTLAILDEEGEDGGAGSAGGVFHCFTESAEVARWVPDDRLLIETDAPYLAPVPYRGKINTPAYVPHVAARLAELRGVGVDHIGQLTSANFTRLFLKTAP